MRMNRQLSRKVATREPVIVEPRTGRLAPASDKFRAIGVVVGRLIEWTDRRCNPDQDRVGEMLVVAQQLASAHQRDRMHRAPPRALRNVIARTGKSIRSKARRPIAPNRRSRDQTPSHRIRFTRGLGAAGLRDYPHACRQSIERPPCLL
jgi:hypothetical protein